MTPAYRLTSGPSDSDLGRRFLADYHRAFESAERQLARHTSLRGAGLRLFTQRLFNGLMLRRFVECRRQTMPANTAKPACSAGASPVAEPSDTGEAPVLQPAACDELSAAVPPALLVDLLGPDGLFYRYPFSAKESLDDGAIDPEVIGTVFEQLVTGRHEAGAYYTPRPVVAFMCREGLKGYLVGRTLAAPDAIAALVDHRDITHLGTNDRRQVREALTHLKALDPACGSGAYLVGLLHELLDLHRLLGDRRSASELTAFISSHNLHGADLDPAAAEIARLRLWLALATADGLVPAHDLTINLVAGDALMDTDFVASFPAVFAAGGFDLVLANPPYVRQELISPRRKRALLARFPDAADGTSDLYVYFFVRALDLLRPGGLHVFICSNSWLDVAYGRKLQQYLLSRAQILAVYESAVDRQFASADINTAITVLRKNPKLPAGNRHAELSEGSRLVGAQILRCAHDDAAAGVTEEVASTCFVSLHAPWDVALGDPALRRERVVSRGDLLHTGKWGGRYLRAPDVYHTILHRAGDSFAPLAELATMRRGYTSGANGFFFVRLVSEQGGIATVRAGDGTEHRLEAEYVRQPIVVNTAEITCPMIDPAILGYRLVHLNAAARDKPHASKYIAWGERVHGFHRRPTTRSRPCWYVLPRRRPCHLLVPIGHDRRAVVGLAHGAVAGDNLVEVTLHEPTWAPLVAGALLSTFTMLVCEITGRANFGQGLLKTQAYEIAELPVPDPRKLSDAARLRLESTFLAMARRPPLPVDQEVQRPDRRALDDALLSATGFDGDTERRQTLGTLHQATCARVLARIARAASAP